MKVFYCYRAFFIIIFFFSLNIPNATAVNCDVEIKDSYLNSYNFRQNDSVSISYVFVSRNSGFPPYQNCDLIAYASSDTTITEDDIYLGSTSVNVHTIGTGTKRGSFTGHFPLNIPIGNYYVGIISSDDSDMSNNVGYDPNPVSIDYVIFPDLALNFIRMFDVDILFPGQSDKFLFSLKNIGIINAESTSVALYASSDSIITQDDYLLGFALVGTLTPNQETNPNRTWDFSLPDNIPPGDYYIGGIAYCSTYEDNLNNNSFCGDTFTVLTPIDVSVQDVTIASKMYRPSNPFYITTTIKNVGKYSSNEYTIDFYATNNTTTSLLLCSCERTGLEHGEQVIFDTLCQFPANIPPDYYYIQAFLECHNDIDEDNNYAESYPPVWVGPMADLSVELVDVNNVVYMPGDQINVYTLIKNIGDRASEAYTVDFYASTDATITNQDLPIGSVTREGLAVGGQHSYNTTCQFPQVPIRLPAGNYYIGAIVTCPIDYSIENNTGYDKTTLQIVHPAGYIYGKMKYKTQLPIRYAGVKVFSEDNNGNPLDDRVIGQTNTDDNGLYNLIIPDDANSTNKIYIKVFSEGVGGVYPETSSNICSIRDAVFDQTYSLKSALCSHPHYSSLRVDLTTSNLEYSNGAFSVFDSVIEGFILANTLFGIELDEITAYWPSQENMTFYLPSPAAELYIAQGDNHDRDVILHEYGHYIADTNDFALGNVGENPIHYWNLDLRYNPENRTDKQAKNLAFREAWATFFSIASQYHQTWYPNSGDTCYQDFDDISGKTMTLDLEGGNNTNYSPGQYYENMNCCALWDIFDENNYSADNNDTLSDTSMVKIWTTMKNYKPEDITDFWNGWFRSFQYTTEMTRIFNNHNIEH
jgi:hypothetical protein